MSRTRRIGIFSGGRADFGLLSPVLRAVAATPGLAPRLVLGGEHLIPGSSSRAEVAAEGWSVAAELAPPPAGDDRAAAARTVGETTRLAAERLPDLALDALIVLGDRYETLGVAAAAAVMGLPLVHLEGGHVTEGAFDDAIRHAITKLADLHFTSEPEYAARLIQMGEPEARVFVVGSTALDLPAGATTDLQTLGQAVGLDLSPGFLLVTWHPATLSDRPPEVEIDAVLGALEDGDRRLLFTAPNADPGRDAVMAAIGAFVARRTDRAVLRESLGHALYLQAMRLADAVVGNSSSGLLEAPRLGVPVVNIGDRQKGRLRRPGVVDCPATTPAIRQALRQALAPDFRPSAPASTETGAGARIARIIADVDFATLGPKGFVDRPGGGGA